MGQWVMLLKLEDYRFRKYYFYYEGVEAMAQVAQKCGRCPIPGRIQGQV